MRRSFAVFVLVAALAAPLVVVAAGPSSVASAANAAQFDPGNLISDEAFYNGAALTADQVQAFLAQKVPDCAAGFTCLADYRQDTPHVAASSLCAAYAGGQTERAADIIAKVGAACNISQKALLVLLEKEMSLVTLRNPAGWRFDKATGYSCPDTAPCDPAYAGFFYQVYHAARQFQSYAANPTRWNYQAGRVNHILFHPNTACGSAPVFIQNKATAGLYIYTPYQPNAAALANLYATGDGCSSYGNRNFWRIFSDWFGSPTVASSLLRTADNGTVYLVSGEYKYPVPSLQTLQELSPLGSVAYVSVRYLDSFATAHSVGRTARDSNGTIYFLGSGIKLPITSCALAADYGGSCEPTGYVQLTGAQIGSFVTGPHLTPVTATVEGARYLVQSGSKREILDDLTQAEAGIVAGANVLTENALSHLRLAEPLIRDSAFALTRSTRDFSLLAQGERYPVGGPQSAAFGVATRTSGSLWPASMHMVPMSDRPFEGIVSTSKEGVGIVSASGRHQVAGGGLSASAAVPISAALADSYPDLGPIEPGSFVKSPDNATVYVVMPHDVRPVSSWDALVALSSNAQPVINTIPQVVVSNFEEGAVALTAGTLVRSPEDSTVYFVNGVTSRIALSSFEYTNEAGFSKLVFASDSRIRAYPLEPKLMSFGFECDTGAYVSAGGSMHYLAPGLKGQYPFDYVPIDRFTCARMPIGSPATEFIRTADGSIFQLIAGQKRGIGSMTRFAELSGGQGWLEVSARFAASIPNGPAA